MAVMVYYMLTMSEAGHCHEQDTGSDTNSSLAANTTVEGCRQMLMVVHGLSLRNLLLFVFCTPCQVRRECSLRALSGETPVLVTHLVR